ncbi:L-aspartate oxidase [Herbiconiux sp.]|uniref:L-aspartate oxidase n=1 Tax=Herbiconiux sp. TaxID=1871186 RepID=UPI0025B94677|nr:L-aspartate oxidase [Herbiconiux sp.]
MGAAGRRPHVVVVGSGVAGLVTALALGDGVDVTIVTKSTIDESNTRYAQGGIAAAVMPGDSVASHVADTLVAGAGLSDPAAVEVLCEEGPARIRDLVQWGVDFDRQTDDPASDFDAGLEGAHSFHRILHAGGDATGFEVEWALVRAVRASGARVIEQAFVVDLVRAADAAHDASGVLGGDAAADRLDAASRVVGVEVLRDGVVETLSADAVVLASGGVGQLYPHTTNPTVTTGDGAAAALRAGAVLADVEFVQFHPTALAVPGSFLVSEAVRGDGAVLRNNAGERFMEAVHPLAELAPRDIVARAIATEMARTGAPVVLDATAIGAEELERRFPTISAASRDHGFDWSREAIPVAPAAHYWMGGVATDLDGRTSVDGLWAVGEVSCTGVHGANRLASNSLLESLVFAHRAAAALSRELPAPASPSTPDATLAAAGGPTPDAASRWIWPEPRGAHKEESAPETGPQLLPSAERGRNSSAASGPARAAHHEPTRTELHEVMWRHVGVHRDADGLRAARDILSRWEVVIDDPATTPIERLETANLVQLARVMVDSALEREESRGAHYRADFPEADPGFARHLTLVEPPTAAAGPRIEARRSIRATPTVVATAGDASAHGSATEQATELREEVGV